MRHAIETAPRDGTVVILEHDPTGTYDVAHWSPEAGNWVSENGEPSEITPTHWRPMWDDEGYPQQEDDESSNISQSGSPSRVRQLVVACSITVALVASVLIGPYLDFGELSLVPAENSRKTESLTVRQAGSERAGVQTQAAVRTRQAAEEPQRRQSSEKELPREVLMQLPDARRAIEGLHVQLKAEAASNAQLLDQERQKTAALARESAAAQQELTTSTAEHRQALAEERARSAALADELAAAQRTIEAQATQLRKANEETAQFKQAEAANGALSLEQERQKTAALAQQAAAARQELTTGTATHRQTLDEERARGAALAGELAAAQRVIEAQTAQMRQANEEAAQLQQTAAATSAQSLEQERQKTAALAQQAAAARQELAANTTKHRQALDEEGAQRARLWSELAGARREIDALAAQLKASEEAQQLRDSEAGNSAVSFDQERQKATALAQEAAAARAELTEKSTTYRQTLDEERAQRAKLWSELTGAKQEIDTLAAQLRKASEEAQQLRQTEAANSALSLDQERQKAAALAQEAAAARQELAANSATYRQAHDEERARRAALESEIATARHERETQAAQLHKASEETRLLRQVTENSIRALQQSLQQERHRTEAMARDIEAARRTTEPRAVPEATANSSISETVQMIETAASAQPALEAQASPEAMRLIARARALLGQGNISAARIVLERAAETGNAQASFTLAETYDPVILSTWGTYGTRGDTTKARELYARAHAGGIQGAKDRLEKLDQ